MSEIVKITTHGDDAVDRLPTQYREKTGMEALARLSGDQAQAIEDALYEMIEDGSIGAGHDYLLDQIGDVVGQPRFGRADDTYKIRILAKIGQNVSRGTGENLIAIFKALMGAERVYFNPLYPAGFYLTAIGGTPVGTIAEVRAALEQSHTGGVKLRWIESAPSVSFSFLDDPDPNGQGFGDLNDLAVGGTLATIL